MELYIVIFIEKLLILIDLSFDFDGLCYDLVKYERQLFEVDISK